MATFCVINVNCLLICSACLFQHSDAIESKVYLGSSDVQVQMHKYWTVECEEFLQVSWDPFESPHETHWKISDGNASLWSSSIYYLQKLPRTSGRQFYRKAVVRLIRRINGMRRSPSEQFEKWKKQWRKSQSSIFIDEQSQIDVIEEYGPQLESKFWAKICD